MEKSLKITIIALDIFGEKVAERLADIADQRIILKENISTDLVFNREEKNVVFVCGFDNNPGFMKIDDDSNLLAFTVRAIAFGETAFADGDHPAANTIYVSPKPVSLYTPPDVYFEQCVTQAERHIANIVRLGLNDDCYIPLSFEKYEKFFSGTYFVDSFSVEKPRFSQFNEETGRIVSMCEACAKKSGKPSVGFSLKISSDVTLQEFDEFLNNMDSALPGVKRVSTLAYNEDNEMPASLSVVIVSR